MRRRLAQRDVERAALLTAGRRDPDSSGGAKEALLTKLTAMEEARAASADRLRAAGYEVREPTAAEILAGADRWVDEARQDVQAAQQLLIDRATGRAPYVSDEARHRAAQDEMDLSRVESAKVRLSLGLRYRAEMRRRFHDGSGAT